MDLGSDQFDLVKQGEEGAWMVLRDPKDLARELPCRILLKSGQSKTWRKLEDGEQNARAEQYSKRNGKMKFKAENLREAGNRHLARVTMQWEGIEWEGQVLECTYQNALMLYTERPWIGTQVDEFITDPANFGASEDVEKFTSVFSEQSQKAGIEANF